MKRIYKLFIFVITVVLAINSVCINTFAASSKSITVSGPSSVYQGDEFEVDVTVSGNTLYGISGEVQFDSSALSVKSVTSELNGDWEFESNIIDNNIYFAAADATQNLPISGKTKAFCITFEAISDISTKASIVPSNVEFSNKEALIKNVDVKGYKVSIIPSDDEYEEDGPSNNNKLSMLKVNNAEITPDFDPEIKVYNANVPFKIKELDVEATAQDEKATVNISDTELKYVGKNIVRVQVLSQSGLKRTYKIYVMRSKPAKQTRTVTTEFLPTWAIIAIIAGSILLALFIVFLIIFIVKKKRKNKN